MQIWSEDLLHDVVLYNPISKLVSKHFYVGNAICMNQLVVSSNLALAHTNGKYSRLSVCGVLPLMH